MVYEELGKVCRGETGVGEMWTVGGFVAGVEAENFDADTEAGVDGDRVEIDVNGRVDGCAFLDPRSFFFVDGV
jgi:hypothetical protein